MSLNAPKELVELSAARQSRHDEVIKLLEGKSREQALNIVLSYLRDDHLNRLPHYLRNDRDAILALESMPE
jgi:hypothetical protein